RVTLTLPARMPERAGRDFAEEKAGWLKDAVDKVMEPVQVTLGATVPVEDRMLPVIAGEGRSARLTPSAIEAPPGREGPTIEALLKALARERLAQSVRQFTTSLGRSQKRMTLRDTRSRWGSCSSEGNLMFSWRLVMAPEYVLAYVAAHEVAHLKHMDHSLDFWATVRELYPGEPSARLWLKRNGSALHRYRFRRSD
ncbi:MAG: SprT family zinc-dependent metalloprotease, partial [Pseudomonadota bacterium]